MLEQALTSNRTMLSNLMEDSGPTVYLKAEATRWKRFRSGYLNQPFKRYLVVEEGKTIGIVLYRHLTCSLIRGAIRQKRLEHWQEPVAWLEPDVTLLEAMQSYA